MTNRVAIIGLHLPEPRQLGAFTVEGVPNLPLVGAKLQLSLLPRVGMDGAFPARAVLKAEWLDELYRDRVPWYMAACEAQLKLLADYDIVVFSTYSLLHPEIIASELSGKTRVLGFTDDPHATYTRGIPYLWAFDAAYYISPSYSPTKSFAKMFEDLRFARARWLPLAQPIDFPLLSREQIRNRSIGACYVGNPTRSKLERFARLRRALGADFRLHGRWRFNGYFGYVAPLLGQAFMPERVTSLTKAGKTALYLDTKIGMNMHVSDVPSECGNMRTYEAPQFGMMLLCDRGGLNLQATIFEEGKEAIYYSDTEEAIDLIRHYSGNEGARTEIALAGHRRAHADYRWEKVWLDFLNWL